MQIISASYKVYIFDLDNTLYDEKDYLFEAYSFIGRYVSSHSNCKQNDVTAFLINEFLANGHKHLFDKLNQKFSVDFPLEDYLNLLRNFKCSNKYPLFPEMFQLLQRLKAENKIIYIATNGNRAQQENKINSIEWNGIINGINIVYCNDFEPKPSPVSLRYILSEEGVAPKDAIFIGDSETDKDAAEGAGIFFTYSNLIQNAG